MKIVKSFKDPEFFRSRYGDDPDDTWEWGLGDDGELYYRCNKFAGNDWHNMGYVNIIFTLRDMKRIVKQFGHLVVFT